MRLSSASGGSLPARRSAEGEDAAGRIERGIAALGLSFDAAARRRMIGYAGLLARRGRGEELAGRQLIDCLAVSSRLAQGTIADVGSGDGLPGIPLAIASPGRVVTLIESHHEKAAFLRAAAGGLGLANVRVVAERVESWSTPRTFDTVISRALCDLGEFVRLAGRLCAAGGTLAAMKPMYPYEELATIPAGFRLREVVALGVPGGSAGHHLVLLDSAA